MMVSHTMIYKQCDTAAASGLQPHEQRNLMGNGSAFHVAALCRTRTFTYPLDNDTGGGSNRKFIFSVHFTATFALPIHYLQTNAAQFQIRYLTD